MNTSMPSPKRTLLDRVNNNLTIGVPKTPISGTSSRSASSSPARVSPSSEDTSSTTSIQPSPDCLQPRDYSFVNQLETFALPESDLGISYPRLNSSDATLTEKSGLVRRLSKNASKAVGKRRPSNNVTSKETSVGPTVRRRNNSIQDSVNAQKALPIVGPDGSIEPLQHIRRQRSFQEYDDTLEYTTPEEEEQFSGVIIPPTTMIKLSKKIRSRKRRTRTFVMDRDAAIVGWDSHDTSKRILVDDIHGTMAGPMNRCHFREAAVESEEEERWLVIHYTDSRKKNRAPQCLHLLAPTKEAVQLWAQSLSFLSRYRETTMVTLPYLNTSQVERLWAELMSKRPDRIGASANEARLPDVQSFCDDFHLNSSPETIRALFKQVDTDHNEILSPAEFDVFIRQLLRRDDVKRIYDNACIDHSQGMQFDDFVIFLRTQQAWSAEAVDRVGRDVFRKFADAHQASCESPPAQDVRPVTTMTVENFDRFLRSTTHNSATVDLPATYQLTRPLNEYYIASSHNTYLPHRQIWSEGSHAAYVKALVEGCRCIEIDCWPGTKQTKVGRPEVRHRAWTTPINFSDVIRTVKEYAFRSSPYPLIISLEVHCNAKEQDMMAEELKTILGPALVTRPLFEGSTVLPSPDQLEGRILIKVKPGMLEETPTYTPDSPISRALSFDVDQTPRSPRVTSVMPSRSTSFRKTHRVPRSAGPVESPNDSGFFEAAESRDSGPPRILPDRKTVKSKITRSLGDLAVYTKGMKFEGDWDRPGMLSYDHVVSVKEGRLNEFNSKPAMIAQLEKHNRKFFMRTYPDQGRLNSTNFNPLLHWRRGVQMVAENWQTYDLGQQLNRAMFAGGTDRLGYVLKPEEMRDAGPGSEPLIDPVSGERVRETRVVRFSIDMISAQRLTRRANGPRSINPYVEIEVFVADDAGKDVAFCQGHQDSQRKVTATGLGDPLRVRTAAVKANGLNPVWNQSLQFTLNTRYESLVFVRFHVKSEGSDATHGMFTVKLTSLATGFRYLPLFDNCGNPYIFSNLFCKIIKEPTVRGWAEPLRIERTGGRLLSRTQSRRNTPMPSRVASFDRH